MPRRGPAGFKVTCFACGTRYCKLLDNQSCWLFYALFCALFCCASQRLLRASARADVRWSVPFWSEDLLRETARRFGEGARTSVGGGRCFWQSAQLLSPRDRQLSAEALIRRVRHSAAVD